MTYCSQCGKKAVVTINGNPLCVDCYLKFQQAVNIQATNLVHEMNYLTDTIESTIGLYGVLPRYKIPQIGVYKGPLTLNNINVDNSIIGSINTGDVKQIDVAMDQIKKSGNDILLKALKEFTESVINTEKLNKNLKNEIIEQISFVTSQSVLLKEKQKTGILRGVLLGIKNIVTPIPSLLTLWDKLQPLLEHIFHIQIM